MRTFGWPVLILLGGLAGRATAQQAEMAPETAAAVANAKRFECVGLALTTLPGGRPVTVEKTGRGITPRFPATGFVNLGMAAIFRQGGKVFPEQLEVTVFTPKGFVYQRWSVPVEQVETPRATFEVPLPALPVGGTAIVSSGLYGLWSVTVSAGESVVPCTLRFQLIESWKKN